MASSLTHLGTGAVLGFVTCLATWLYLLAAGEPFGTWGWTALTFCLLLVEVIILAILAAASSPFEARLMRWRAVADPLGRNTLDPLAIGFQMDLTASEANPPRQATGESRWLWISAVPLIAALALGVTLATSDGGSTRYTIISGAEAVAIADRALERSPDDPRRTLLGYEVHPASDASARLSGQLNFPVTDAQQLVFVVFFTTTGSVKEPGHDPTAPGPVAVIDSESGAVLGTGAATYGIDRR